MRSGRWRAACAVLVAVGLGVSGCAEQPKPSPPPVVEPEDTRPTSSAPKASPATTKATARPTGTGEFARDEDGYPVMPAVAKENTKEGAEAFARWYMAMISELAHQPKRGMLEPHSSSTCKTCANYAGAFKKSEIDGSHWERPVFILKKTRHIGRESKRDYDWNVVVPMTPQRNRLLDKGGQVIQSGKQERDLVMLVSVRRTPEAWAVAEIMVEESSRD